MLSQPGVFHTQSPSGNEDLELINFNCPALGAGRAGQIQEGSSSSRESTENPPFKVLWNFYVWEMGGEGKTG